jgi:hypothetical protein
MTPGQLNTIKRYIPSNCGLIQWKIAALLHHWVNLMENGGSPAPLEKHILPLLLDSLLIPQFNTNQYHFGRHSLRGDIHVQVHLP